MLSIYLETMQKDGRAVVEQEVLKYRRGSHGKPWEFLHFRRGRGKAVTNEGLETVKEEQDLEREEQQLKSANILAIKGLAQFEKFPAVVALGNLIERWHLSDIHISTARNEQQAGFAEHVSREGENLSLVIDYLYHHHHHTLMKIIEAMKHRIPGIEEVNTKIIETGQVLLTIKDTSFEDPFLVRYVSDGAVRCLCPRILPTCSMR
ncbi:MAG: AAA family ATPase [Salinispira sp.]